MVWPIREVVSTICAHLRLEQKASQRRETVSNLSPDNRPNRRMDTPGIRSTPSAPPVQGPKCVFGFFLFSPPLIALRQPLDCAEATTTSSDYGMLIGQDWDPAPRI